MKEAGVDQSELARRLGIKSQAVNQWLKRGGTTPRGRRLFDVADALGIELSKLLGESPDRTSSLEQERADWVAAFDATDPRDRAMLVDVARRLRRSGSPRRKPPPPPPKERPPPPRPHWRGSIPDRRASDRAGPRTNGPARREGD